MRLQLVTLLLFLLQSGALFAQTEKEIYPLSTARRSNLLFSGIGLTTALSGLLLEQRINPYSADQLEALSLPKLNDLDQKSTNWYSAQFATTSNVLKFSSVALPLVLFATKQSKPERAQLLFQWSQVTSLTWGVTSITKSLAQRDRPFLFNPNVPFEEKLKAEARLSLFSGHTSITAASWFFLAQHVQRYSNTKWVKALTWIGAITIPAFTGYARMRAGQHYFTDVAAGYLVGAGIGFFIPKFHANYAQKNRKQKLN
ncbi:MAG: membrane-associated phospholipid phosphatase [Flavobacteriales bacterium]|jgi:membrane-associated phospholipid phosphatase